MLAQDFPRHLTLVPPVLPVRDADGTQDDDIGLIKRNGRYRVYDLSCSGGGVLRDYYVKAHIWDREAGDFDTVEFCYTVPAGVGEFRKVASFCESLQPVGSSYTWDDADDSDARERRFLETVGIAEDEF